MLYLSVLLEYLKNLQRQLFLLIIHLHKDSYDLQDTIVILGRTHALLSTRACMFMFMFT